MYRFLRLMAMLFALAGGAAAAGVGFITAASIVGRALWSAPISGDIEITQFGIALCISLCLPWCQLHGANIIVDFFTMKAERAHPAIARRRWRSAAGRHDGPAGMAHGGRGDVGQGGRRGIDDPRPRMWLVYGVLAPGFALTMLIAIYQAVMHFLGRESEAVA